MNKSDHIEKYVVKLFLQNSKLLLFFSRIMIDDILNISPDDSLTFLMKSSTLIKMFRTSFTHKCRHRTRRIDTNWKTSMSVNTFWGFLHFLTFLIIISFFKRLIKEIKNISSSLLNYVNLMKWLKKPQEMRNFPRMKK